MSDASGRARGGPPGGPGDPAVRGLDVAALDRWLRAVRPDLVDGPLEVSLITHGRSNLTYRVHGPRVPLVLRRPPLGHVLASAHDMVREHRVVAALAPTAVPVPAAVGLGVPGQEGIVQEVAGQEAAGQVTGTPFFVMEEVDGRVLATPQDNAGITPAGARALSRGLAETLAELHAVDPASVGLGDLGRPHGYLRRQMATWRRQLDASRSRDLPDLDALQDALDATVPDGDRGAGALVHGDYRLDNALVVGEQEPRISAVLDWEMATLGDPLVDLGLLGLYWEVSDLPPPAAALVRSAVDPAAGYPGFPDVVADYARRAAGLRAHPPDPAGPRPADRADRAGPTDPDELLGALSWYRAFAAYKLAVIVEQIHFRRRSGSGLGGGQDDIGGLVAPLAARGLALAAGNG